MIYRFYPMNSNNNNINSNNNNPVNSFENLVIPDHTFLFPVILHLPLTSVFAARSCSKQRK